MERSRTEFWGEGKRHVEAGGFSFHHLCATLPEDAVDLHTHAEAHFILVLSGGYISSAKGAPAVSSAPLLIYNPPGTTHRDRFLKGQGTFLAVSGGEAGPDGEAFSLTDPLAHHFARTIVRGLHDGRCTRFELEALALELLAAVAPRGRESPAGACRPPAWLKFAFELIFTGDDPDLTVSDVAAAAGVHRVHLARVFREFLECSPGEVLRGRRLERAAQMIGGSTASLADIACATGFVDQSHLTRTFRQRLGATPTAWRRRCCIDPRPGA